MEAPTEPPSPRRRKMDDLSTGQSKMEGDIDIPLQYNNNNIIIILCKLAAHEPRKLAMMSPQKSYGGTIRNGKDYEKRTEERKSGSE